MTGIPEDLDRLLSGGPVLPAAPGGAKKTPGIDPDLDSLLKGGTPTAAPEGPAKPEVPLDLDRMLTTGRETPGIVESLFSGAAQNAMTIAATPKGIESIYHDIAGDKPAAIAAGKTAKEISDIAPDPYWSLDNIHSPSDFAAYAAEKLGQNSITMLAMLLTGGTSAIATGYARDQLIKRGIIGPATARVMTKAGEYGPVYGLSSTMEAAGTTSEQLDATGDPHGALSAGAGALKGLLELWAPMSLLKAFKQPGLQLGKSIPGAIAKTAGKEGLTEALQEVVDVTARQYTDPGYSYFGSGPNWWWGPGFSRVVEAGAAGALVGGVFGGPAALHERRIERQRLLGDQPPGSRVEKAILPDAPQPPMEALAPDKVSFDKQVRKSTGIEDWFVSSDFGSIYATVDPKTKVARIDSSGLDVAGAQGQGHGMALYKALADEVLKQGYQLHSDRIVSAEAERAYQGLERRGYRVERTGDKVVIAKDAYGSAKVSDKPGIFRVTRGPVSQLRDVVINPRSEEKLPEEAWFKNPMDDALGVGALSQSFPRMQREAALDWIEANTPRYAIQQPDGRPGDRFFNNTELERHMATRPQAEKPTIIRIDQESLQGAAITAHISDLPEPASNRIWFLQGTKPAQKAALMARYVQVQEHFSPMRDAALKKSSEYTEFEQLARPYYDELLSGGLRVVPSRGAGFYYTGLVDPSNSPVVSMAEVANTHRSEKIAFYNPVTLQVTRFTDNLENLNLYEQVGPEAVVVSLDMNKVRPQDIAMLPSGDFLLKHPLDVSKLTPGVRMVLPENIAALSTGYPASDVMKVRQENVLPENIEVANKIAGIVQNALPAMKAALQDLGIDQNVWVVLTDKAPQGSNSAAWVHTDLGLIGIAPGKVEEVVQKGWATKELESDVLVFLGHELGHQITHHHFKNLTTELQQQLLYAWGAAQLANRMNPRNEVTVGSQRADLPGGIGVANREYSLGFNEWLAEQYRRWGMSDEVAKGQMEFALKEGAKKLERFYTSWGQRHGELARMDLTHPDYYFSAAMEYLRNYGNARQGALQALRQQALYSIPQELFDTPASLDIVRQFQAAVESMLLMFPQDVQLQAKEALDANIIPGFDMRPDPRAVARWIHSPRNNLKIIEFALGAMPKEGGEAAARTRISHELMHSYEDLNLITQKEIDILMKDIRARKMELDKGYKEALSRRLREWYSKYNWPEEAIRAKIEETYGREQRAYYIQEYANSGLALSQEAKPIMQRFLDFVERVRNFMQGLGYQSRDDVIRAFFKGEMVARAERQVENHAASMWLTAQEDIPPQEAQDSGLQADKKVEVESGVQMHVRYGPSGEIRNSEGVLQSKAVHYFFMSGQQLVGSLSLYHRGRKGYEIRGLSSQASTIGQMRFAYKMLNYVAKDVGLPLVNAQDSSQQLAKLPGAIEASALPVYVQWARVGSIFDVSNLSSMFKYYVEDKARGLYLSPVHIQEKLNFYQIQKARLRAGLRLANPLYTEEFINSRIEMFKAFKARVPAEAWSDPGLEQMFSLRKNVLRDGVQGSIIREAANVDDTNVRSMLQGGPRGTDSFTAVASLKQHLSQAENARELGVDFRLAAPAQPLALEAWSGVRILAEKALGRDGMSPEVLKAIKNTKHEQDRIGWFTKRFWGLHQLAWRNPKLFQLGNYLQRNELMNQLATKWLRRADETARLWDKRSAESRTQIANVLFALTKMEYRLPFENATRLPDNWPQFLAGQQIPKGGELNRLFEKHELKPEDQPIIRLVQRDFMEFLDEVERIRQEKIGRTFATDAAGRAAALAGLTIEMGELRSKPYFPMVRFGEFTAAIRNPQDHNRVLHHEAFITQHERDAAALEMKKKYPGKNLIVGRVPESMIEFQTLPGPLIRAIKEGLHEGQQRLSPQQLAWLEEFEMQNAPDKSFKKRWLPTNQIPGYNMDAFRGYAHYFQNGARYLSRLAYADDLQRDIQSLQNTINSGSIGNYEKRAQIVRYMQDHFHYVMEPGHDSGKFRAFVALWYLGFSPAAAAMNLTQTVGITIPTLWGHFGVMQASSTLSKVADAVRAQNGIATGTPAFMKAKEEMANQGRIDVGQAPELGAYAEGYNLLKMGAGSKAQHWWRQASYYGMYMFQATEHFNRQLVMKSAWDLAVANPRTPRLREIGDEHFLEVGDLVRRLGFNETEAIAFLFAKEMIDRTQYTYAKYTDPPFMRGKYSKDLTIFLKYTQSTLYAMRFNGAAAQMLMIQALLYGLGGLPGSDELNELIKFGNNLLEKLGLKLFGKDLDLHREARGYVRALTKGTIYDQVGPDLLMHGISRYGFGLGLLPHGYGNVPFDASANGSLGRIVPGLAEALHGWNNGGAKWNDVFAEAALKASGAGYGLMFSTLQALTSPPGSDSWKNAEAFMPRALKAVSKATRYGYTGAETSRSGARIMKFDATDPEDIAAVVGQALGFTPTKLAEKWAAMRESQEVLQSYQAQRLFLYTQMDAAVKAKSPEAIADVTRAITEFNNGVKDKDPTMVIRAPALLSALRSRNQTRYLQEEFGANSKRDLPVSQRVQDLYPGTQKRVVK